MLRYLASYVGLGGGGPDREQSLPDRVKMWYKTLEDAESYGEWLTAVRSHPAFQIPACSLARPLRLTPVPTFAGFRSRCASGEAI